MHGGAAQSLQISFLFLHIELMRRVLETLLAGGCQIAVVVTLEMISSQWTLLVCPLSKRQIHHNQNFLLNNTPFADIEEAKVIQTLI